MDRRPLSTRPIRCGNLLKPVAVALMWCACAGIVDSRASAREPLPDFSRIEPASARKAQFFDYLEPVIRAQNRHIHRQRQRLLDIVEMVRGGGDPGWQARQFLHGLARQYRLDPRALDMPHLLERLLRRVDVIPMSLAMVQAAKESAWGSSRFARQCNNLFGQQCFEQGCGVVPRRRRPGATHEVARFASVADAVASYLRNLNTHPSYASLRKLRARLRQRNAPLSGVQLAQGLRRYSERGVVYVREVQSMIRQSGLEQRRRKTLDVQLAMPAGAP